MKFGRWRLKRMAMSWAIPTSYVCLSHCICGRMHSKVIGLNLFPYELLVIVNISLWTNTLTIKEHRSTRASGTICNLIYQSIGYMACGPPQMQLDALFWWGVSVHVDILTMIGSLWGNKVITLRLLAPIR
jgi:hypothetical protein